jgi:hypothetical protein
MGVFYAHDIQRECIATYNRYKHWINNILEGYTNIGQEQKNVKHTKNFIMGYQKCSKKFWRRKSGQQPLTKETRCVSHNGPTREKN